ncbi:hypothetical protein OEA41_005591 [Lepraria neglecta]|uniref:Uncharacterized protein n=1 Tax=Lepraria neglecta TaxID=209136 RepID=A0AAE0DJW0_9LECA|nr:hypothetical protein OEA41_005591 [Lepraria neglecta]
MEPIPRFFRIDALIAMLKRIYASHRQHKHQQDFSSSFGYDEEEEEEEEERTCFRDSQLEKYESTYKWLAARSQQERQDRIVGVELVENCRANRVDIVEDNLWL